SINQTLNYINQALVYINQSLNYINQTLVYRFPLEKRTFSLNQMSMLQRRMSFESGRRKKTPVYQHQSVKQ
ncbi:MAG: hypothetical protein D8B56_05210, partial [Alloprevotella sp.]